MKTSELIKILEDKLKEHGDLECFIEANAEPEIEGNGTADLYCVTTMMTGYQDPAFKEGLEVVPDYNLLITKYTSIEMD